MPTTIQIDELHQHGLPWWGLVLIVISAIALYDVTIWAWNTLIDRWQERRNPAPNGTIDEYNGVVDEIDGENIPADIPAPFMAERPETWTADRKWWTTPGGRLHRVECRYLVGPDGHARGNPWPWADTLAEALHYAAEQELTPCKECKPLDGDPQHVVGDRDAGEPHLVAGRSS